MTATCDELRRRLDPDAPACSSSCHDPAAGAAYCAPLRCYCGGCPAFVAIERAAGPMTVEQLEDRHRQLIEGTRRQLVAAREADDLAAALAGEPTMAPRLTGWRSQVGGGRLSTASCELVAA